MLFVGFSLNDENFHRIMDAVRSAVPENSPPVGTSLTLHSVALQVQFNISFHYFIISLIIFLFLSFIN